MGYGLQLHEKQKAKRMYFTLKGHSAKLRKANRATGVTGELLIQQLDAVWTMWLIGWVLPSAAAGTARVRHGHVTVNGRKVNIPSYQMNAATKSPSARVPRSR